MKILLIAVLFISSNTFSQGSIATYNIRYDGHTDLANDWVERKVPIAQFVFNNQIDIIGFQEVLHNQLLDLQTLLPHYKYVGVGRDDGKTQGEYSPIFYDATKFEALSSGTFWLSPTPQIPSKGWDAALNRICTFVLLKEINGSELTWVFNTHFDHIGSEARLHSSELILDQISEFLQAQDAPVLLIGDFNMEDTDEGIELIRTRFKDFSCVKIPDQKRRKKNHEICFLPTFNGFTATIFDDKRIDYIFGSDSIIPFECKVDTATFGLSYPSDHFPVMVFYKVLR
ncbi:MAG: endonuclease/exonuclease/phosphatase family protein [Flavobacteriales bacterium]